MEVALNDTQNQILEIFDGFTKKIIENTDAEEGKIEFYGRKIIARLPFSQATFYNYGGYDFVDTHREFVEYMDNKGKLKIDIEEAREYYG